MSEPPDQPGLRAGGRRRTRKKARPGAGAEFRGVSRRRNGKYGAQIWGSKAGVRCYIWLGTFDTAEDAARAYHAAAVKQHGAMAATNFKQPTATDGGGVSPLLDEPLSKGNAERSLGGFDLTPAEWRQVDELLKGMDSAEVQDCEALIEGAEILRQISLAGHSDGGTSWSNSNEDRRTAAN